MLKSNAYFQYYSCDFSFALREPYLIYDRKYLDTKDFIIENETGWKQVLADNRPQNVVIPDPQNIKIIGIYHGQVIEINGKTTYSLNNDYDPKMFTKTSQKCQHKPRLSR